MNIDQGLENPKGDRIAKVIARSGVCSRRDAEALIDAGRVIVDGVKLKTPAFVIPFNTFPKIMVDGKELPIKAPPRLWLYHKPKGLVTTHKDPEGRPTVFENLPDGLPRVISVGRLDLNSEGLLLLTNDGELSRYLEHPKTGWERTYRVRVFGKVPNNLQEKLAQGVSIEGIHYGSIKAVIDSQQNHNSWLTLTLTEGKNREIRVVMEYFGLTVSRLLRTAYGPFTLEGVDPGTLKEVSASQLQKYFGGKVPGIDMKPTRRTLSLESSSKPSSTPKSKHAHHRRTSSRPPARKA